MFMSLGHGITDIDTEQIVEIANGETSYSKYYIYKQR